MKVSEFNEMQRYITRQKTPRERARMEKEHNLANRKRMLAKREELGLDKQDLKDMKTWVENTTALNKNPGVFKKAVVEDEKIIDALVKYEDLNPKEQIVTYDSATGLFSNKKKDIAFKDVNTAREHNKVYEKHIPEIQEKNKALNQREPSIAQQVINYSPKKVKPLNQRPRVSDQKIFRNNINQKEHNRPFTKIAKNPGKPKVIPQVKPLDLNAFKFSNYTPYKPEPETQEHQIAKARFDKLVEDNKRDKEFEATRGLPGLIPGASNIVERSERIIKNLNPKQNGGDDDL
jgi:hypothetical protein